MTRDRGVPRTAWVTLVVIVVVGVGVTLGVVLLSTGSSSPPADEVTDPPGEGPGATTVVPGGYDDAPYHRPSDRGVTGEGVSVGVLDVTGFDAGDSRIADRIRAVRSFGDGGGMGHGGTAHGTAAASVVSSVAPDADLYLAEFDSPDDFRRAVDWLLRQDVDVIVAPVSFYGQQDDGSSAVARAAQRASDRGVVFVAATGNLARSHWQGRYDDVEDGRLQFASGSSGTTTVDPGVDRTVPEGSRNYVRGSDRAFTLWLSWGREHADENYTAVLHRVNDSGTTVVARSRPYEGDDSPNERISATLGDGAYFVTVRGPDESTGARLELASPTHRLERGGARGSIVAPATARGVIAVGAYDTSRDEVASFSSRGPTTDGRPGVDVVAPGRYRHENRTRLVGSSAAAPYVAGVAALLRAVEPGMAPARVELAIEATAIDVGRPGYDYPTGHGVVDPWRAVVTVDESAGDGSEVAPAGNETRQAPAPTDGRRIQVGP